MVMLIHFGFNAWAVAATLKSHTGLCGKFDKINNNQHCCGYISRRFHGNIRSQHTKLCHWCNFFP